MTVPGIGPITALTFHSAIDDPARFRCSRLYSYFVDFRVPGYLVPGAISFDFRDVVGIDGSCFVKKSEL